MTFSRGRYVGNGDYTGLGLTKKVGRPSAEECVIRLWPRGKRVLLSEYAGLSRNMVSAYIRGLKRPSVESAERLEEACVRLGIPLKASDWLLPNTRSEEAAKYFLGGTKK